MDQLTPARVFGAALALPQLLIGLWAVLGPRSFYDDFPGLGPALVAAVPPYNPHLTTDAGAGFLATGGLLLGVCVWAGAAEIRVAAIGYLLFCTPHVLWHATHPSALLDAGTDVLNVVLIGAQVAGAVTLIVLCGRVGRSGGPLAGVDGRAG